MTNSQPSLWRAVAAIVRKDLQSERRTRQSLSSMTIFAALLLVIFNFTLGSDPQIAAELGPGILWASVIFMGTLGLNRSFAAEKEHLGMQGILLAPIDRSAIYFAKLISNTLLMVLVEIVLIPLFIIFFNLDLSSLPSSTLAELGLVFFLGTVAYASIGTTLAAIAANSSLREIMLPLLLFPMVVPVVISATEATRMILVSEEVLAVGWTSWSWIRVLLAFALIFIAASWMLFDYVVED